MNICGQNQRNDAIDLSETDVEYGIFQKIDTFFDFNEFDLKNDLKNSYKKFYVQYRFETDFALQQELLLI